MSSEAETGFSEKNLGSKIEQQQLLLGVMEDELRLAADGERAARLEQAIEQVKELVLGYRVEIARQRPAHSPADHSWGERRATFLVNVPFANGAQLAGRQDECLVLDDWLQWDTDHPLLALLGPDGSGKSALAWHWLQGLLSSGRRPPLVAWWNLHETGTALPRLVLALLGHFGEEPRRFSSWAAAANRVVEYLARTPALLILDGVEALLPTFRQQDAGDDEGEYERPAAHVDSLRCADPVAGTFLSWLARPRLTPVKTLLTSHFLPQELAGPGGGGVSGVMRHDLTGLSMPAAQELLSYHRVELSLEEVAGVGGPVGYHPLTLRLLAGLLAAGREGRELAACYGPASSLSASRQVVLSVAYYDLPPAARELLGRLAAFRGSVAAATMAALEKDEGGRMGDEQKNHSSLPLLLRRGWLNQVEWSGQLCYSLHPVIRRFAYGRLANGEGGKMKDEPKNRLSFNLQPSALDELKPAMELFHGLAAAGRYDEALTLYRQRLADPLYYRLGAHTVELELLRALFPEGEDRLPLLADGNAQAWTLNSLGSCYSLGGRPAAAVFHFERSIALYEKRDEKRGMAIALGNLAQDQMALGQLPAANRNLRRSLALSREVGDAYWEAVGHYLRGRLLAYAGDWTGVAAELDLAQSLAAGRASLLAEIWSQAAWAALLQGRGSAGWTAVQEVRRLLGEAKESYAYQERHQARLCWLWGWAEWLRGHLKEAGRQLDEAYAACREGRQPELELVVLLAQARLARAEAGFPAGNSGPRKGDQSPATSRPVRRRPPPGLELAQKARWIGERGGYVLHLADVHNLLALIALDAESPTLAQRHAALARQYATGEDGTFAYRLALAEAQRLLGKMPGD